MDRFHLLQVFVAGGEAEKNEAWASQGVAEYLGLGDNESKAPLAEGESFLDLDRLNLDSAPRSTRKLN